MTWTREQQLAALLQLPWTVRVEHDEDDGMVARVAEIPSAIATGETAEELEKDLWASLSASLEVYLDYGDPIPLPSGIQRLPWEIDPDAPQVEAIAVRYERGEMWRSADTTAALTGAITGQPEPLVACA